MIKHSLLLCLFLGIYVAGISQVLTIIDQDSKEPLQSVTLSSESPKLFTVTNARGQADIGAFAAADKIEIRMVGYETKVNSYSELQRNGFMLAMKGSGISLEQVVVSATRSTNGNDEVTSKVTTISPSDIALSNSQTTADLLGNSGEVYVQKSQMGGGSPMIRGFATNRLLITVDGVRMNTAIFRSGNLQNIISLDPFATEHAEVLFGPGSVMYGSDAIGGVMSFQTLTPQFTFTARPLVSGKAVSRYSSANNERTNHIDVNLGFKNWAFVTSITHSDFHDLRMGKIGPSSYLRPFYVQRQDSMDVVVSNDDPLVQRPTAYSQINLMQKIRVKLNDKWDAVYGFHYSTTTDYARYDRHIRLRDGLPRSAEWKYGPQEWAMNSFTFTNRIKQGIYNEMVIRLAQQYFEESRIDRDFNKDTRFSRVEKVNAYSANVDLMKTIAGKHQLYYGVEFITNDVNSTGTDEDITTGNLFPGPSRYPLSTWASYAGYVTYQHKLSDKLTMQVGSRYNKFTIDAEFDTTFYNFPFTQAKVDNSAVTGSVGLIVYPYNNMSVRVNASSGFRSPNVDDLGKVFDSEAGSVVVPNPDLNAEYAYNVELGIAKVFGESFKIDLAGYYTILQDAMVRRDFTLNDMDSIFYNGEFSQVQAIQNAAEATVYGIQAGVEIKLPSHFRLSSNINYQIGEEELDDGTKSPLRHAAPLFSNSHLIYSFDKLELDFYANYNGEISNKNLADEEKGKDYLYAADKDGNPYSPSWYTLNFKTKYQMTNNFIISGGVENLTDQRYRPYSSGIAAAGRNFILSLSAQF